jgi:hypothetical protein
MSAVRATAHFGGLSDLNVLNVQVVHLQTCADRTAIASNTTPEPNAQRRIHHSIRYDSIAVNIDAISQSANPIIRVGINQSSPITQIVHRHRSDGHRERCTIHKSIRSRSQANAQR